MVEDGRLILSEITRKWTLKIGKNDSEKNQKNTNSIERSWSKKHIDNYFSKKAANPEITE